MYLRTALRAATALSLISVGAAQAETITIATVNNGDMIRMQGYTDDFTAKTGHEVEWVTLEENVLRQRVTTDITTKGGQFDIMTIGMYETPIWGANGWLVPLDDLSDEYDVDDILPAMRNGLSHDGTLYAAPFYGESSMVMYRTDLMEAAGLEMPDAPTWEFIREAAAAMDDPENDINGTVRDGQAIDRLCKHLGKSSDTRITVILPSGVVLGDTEEDDMPPPITYQQAMAELDELWLAYKGTRPPEGRWPGIRRPRATRDREAAPRRSVRSRATRPS